MTNIIPSVKYKDLLLKKLSHSIISSVESQLLILLIYVFFCNCNIFQPIQWIISTINVFTSFNTWIYLLIFLIIVFTQTLICAKDYVYRPNYASTRFQKFVFVFSVQNCILLFLNVVIGAVLMWLLLQLSGSSHKEFLISCSENICLNENNFCLVLSGIWYGIYYFYKVQISGKQLIFPVIYQRKILQIKSQLLPLLKDCCIMALTPTLYFIILYSIWGEIFITKFVQFFEIKSANNHLGVMAYVYLWIYGAIHFYNMNLMRLFFNLFLTEPVTFPLCKSDDYCLSLQDSIQMSNLPIIQNLACLDLYNLSQWSRARRQILFTLSQPGGHPHNWNSLVENVLKLFSEYIQILTKSTEIYENIKSSSPQSSIETVHNIQTAHKFSNIRNMSLISDHGSSDIVELTRAPQPVLVLVKQLSDKFKQKFKEVVTTIKIVLGINFLFGELPQASIQRLLGNGHVIIWTSQGIAELACTSITEDDYGIVQKDLPTIITTLLNLKHNLDKLNKVPALTRRVSNQEEYNFKMKRAISAALKRSLFNIYVTFGNYLHELPLNTDVITQLQGIFKN